ncbi:MAG: guanylate kinase [Halanaerobiales bacterium]|nr:guanylate kinase [Halanaerobiales bacterium]
MQRGLLFVLSGPSGVGKGTVLDHLMKDYNDIEYSVSATTRKPRPGEKDGEDYFFISEEMFKEMEENNEFLETAYVHQNYYGTPKKYVKRCLDRGEDIILEIDIQGAKQIKEKFKDAVYIFLLPPNYEELKNRLVKRDSETEESLKTRLKNANQEIKETDKYDYNVINDDIDDTVMSIKEIIKKERKKKGASIKDE